MKKYFIFVVAIIISIATIASAEIFTIDTRIGAYNVGSLVSYRTSRVAYNIPALCSGRIVHQVYNGMGFKGELNNYRLGFQTVYGLDIPETGITVKPFIGFGINSSDIVTGSLSFDFGTEGTYNLFSWMNASAGVEAITFSDSYMLDYYAGPTFPILDFLTLDVLYTGLLSNDSHRVGFAGRVNLKF